MFKQQYAVSFCGLRPRTPNHSNNKWKETNEACVIYCAISISRPMYVLSRQLQWTSSLPLPSFKTVHDRNLSETAENEREMVSNVILKREIVVSFCRLDLQTSKHQAGYILNVQSNQFVQSKFQSVQSKILNCVPKNCLNLVNAAL